MNAAKRLTIGDTGGAAAKGSLLSEIDRAIRAITISCRDTPAEERAQAIEFLGRGRTSPAIAYTLSDALRRFSHLMTPKEKLKIAELLAASDAMPMMTRNYVRCSLETALQKEVSLEVGEALRRLHQKIAA